MDEYSQIPDIVAFNMQSLAYNNTMYMEPEGKVTFVEATLNYADYLIVASARSRQ